MVSGVYRSVGRNPIVGTTLGSGDGSLATECETLYPVPDSRIQIKTGFISVTSASWILKLNRVFVKNGHHRLLVADWLGLEMIPTTFRYL